MRAVVAAVLGLHGLAGWGLLQIGAVRQALADVAPIFVTVLAESAHTKPPETLPPAPLVPPRRQPKEEPPPPMPILVAAPSPAPVPFAVAPAEVLIETPAPLAVPATAEPPAPVAAPPAPVAAPPRPTSAPPPPKQIPASAVQYLEAPAPVYPRASVRLDESGIVVVRVLIDEGGLPRQVQVARSSGFPRLDEAAVAGVHKARFKPPTENGQPISGWARIDIPFELER